MPHPSSHRNAPSNPNFNSFTSHPSSSSPRKSHKKRGSTLRLSTDTTSSLPEYISVPAGAGWHHHQQQHHSHHQSHSQYPQQQHLHQSFTGSRLGLGVGEEEDKPPDYPDSAEEADEDTDTDATANIVYVPLASPLQRPQTASPRRAKRFLPTHKRRQSLSSNYALQQQLKLSPSQDVEPSDPYLDALLERSVHALEMSNTLLQSSISTQTSLSAILGADSPGDGALEARAMGLSSRIQESWDTRAAWADDLEEISRNVEGLFVEGNNSSPRRRYASRSNPGVMEGGGVSCSLPTGGSLSSMRRRPSLDLRLQSNTTATPRLHYSQQNRDDLISPPPRALTQYVASSQNSESILLPSTIGLRSTPSLHHTPDWKPLSDVASSSTTSLLSTQSYSSPTPVSLPPKLTDKPIEPSTPAYNMLSSFVYRPAPPPSSTPSFLPRRRSSTSNASDRTERRSRSRSSTSSISLKSDDRRTTPIRAVSPIRPMTPPVEEPSSSSSSDGYVAKRTMQSLRKILDDQPAPPQPTSSSASINGQKLRSPAFMPRTPAPVAEAGTSTATASISRLFTKGTHSSSTRAPSPPRVSAMKRHRSPGTSSGVNSPSLSISQSESVNSTAPPTPIPAPSAPALAMTLSLPDLVSKVLKGRSGNVSTESSGRSTPNKRISFAELPESYASTRPPSSRFSKGNKSSSSRKRKGKGGLDDDGSDRAGRGDEEMNSSWWSGWLNPGGVVGGSGLHGLGVSLSRQEERIEDRMTRNWAGRMNAGYGTGLDEWAV